MTALSPLKELNLKILKNILDTYTIEDENGVEITLDRLAEKYFSEPETCFIKDFEE